MFADIQVWEIVHSGNPHHPIHPSQPSSHAPGRCLWVAPDWDLPCRLCSKCSVTSSPKATAYATESLVGPGVNTGFANGGVSSSLSAVYLFCLCVCPHWACLSLHLPACLPACRRLSVCLCVSACLCVSLSVYVSICVFVCLSVCDCGLARLLYHGEWSVVRDDKCFCVD